MNRRRALKQLAFLSGSLLLGPGCTFNPKRVSEVHDRLNITPEKKQLLTKVVHTLIPGSETPGSVDLDIHHFVLVMVYDMHDKRDRKAFLSGLQQIDELTIYQFDKAFSDCSVEQRERTLVHIYEESIRVKLLLGSKFASISTFANLTKKYTIQGYLQSKYFLTEVDPYQLVPGHFNGCVPIERKS